MTTSENNRPATGAFTLFEIILCIALVAIVLGSALPFIPSPSDPSSDASDALAETMASAHDRALDSATALRLAVTSSGLVPSMDSVPAASLPSGWTLQLRRMTDSKFHKPGKHETLEFNSAGICEPVAFRLSNGDSSVTVSFDPLTGLPLPNE